MTRRSAARPAWASLLLVAAAGWSSALETDQYWSWGRPLADSAAAIDAKLNLELERALADSVDRRHARPGCTDVVRAFRRRLRFVLLHDLQIWAVNTTVVARSPEGPEENRAYRRTNLYSNHPLVDPGTWMPITPTIEVAGVRFGTDKLAHFVSSGWLYLEDYRRALGEVGSDDRALRAAVERGMLDESLILGKLTSGILSIADVEAGFSGLRFFRDLCWGEDPVLVQGDQGWVVTRPVEIARYVTPRWDESYQPPVYSAGRWRKVRPVLEGYCDRLADPEVVAQRRRYRSHDTPSPVAEAVAARVAAGRLEDPARFGLEAVCATADPSPSWEAGGGASEPRMAPQDAAVIETAILDEELERRRMTVLVAGAQLGYPQAISASIGAMLTSKPTAYHCDVVCDLRGPFVELEPGLGGARLSLGWARVAGRIGGRVRMLEAGYFGIAYKLSLLRTWGDLGWLAPDRTHAGVGLAVPVAQANLEIGLLYRLSGGDDGRWTMTGGVGWGF
ncbi:MAG: hypothetical protein MUC56_08540 [Thermoanaerobaculales bacterium]|nr:hypothetical protein [Thermoanaerobaculales bacterium]